MHELESLEVKIGRCLDEPNYFVFLYFVVGYFVKLCAVLHHFQW